jgi:hypothetical protein
MVNNKVSLTTTKIECFMDISFPQNLHSRLTKQMVPYLGFTRPHQTHRLWWSGVVLVIMLGLGMN